MKCVEERNVFSACTRPLLGRLRRQEVWDEDSGRCATTEMWTFGIGMSVLVIVRLMCWEENIIHSKVVMNRS